MIKVKDIDTKNRRYYFFNDINVKIFDQNNIKIDEKSCKNILTYCIGYETVKDLKYLKINSINSSYPIFEKENEYFEKKLRQVFNASSYYWEQRKTLKNMKNCGLKSGI